MQAPESVMEIALGSQPLMQESSGPPKIGTDFAEMEQLSKNKTCSKKSVSNY